MDLKHGGFEKLMGNIYADKFFFSGASFIFLVKAMKGLIFQPSLFPTTNLLCYGLNCML